MTPPPNNGIQCHMGKGRRTQLLHRTADGEDADFLLAATASVHGMTLVTRNLKDVERTGIDCLNPFSA